MHNLKTHIRLTRELTRPAPNNMADQSITDSTDAANRGCVRRLVRPTPRAQALIFQPELTHSVWIDVMHRKRSRKSLETMLRKGVRSGEYVGYRLLNIEAEYIGVSWPNDPN